MLGTDLRIDKQQLPLDIRLCSHLEKLSRQCPCPCAFTANHRYASRFGICVNMASYREGDGCHY